MVENSWGAKVQGMAEVNGATGGDRVRASHPGSGARKLDAHHLGLYPSPRVVHRTQYLEL